MSERTSGEPSKLEFSGTKALLFTVAIFLCLGGSADLIAQEPAPELTPEPAAAADASAVNGAAADKPGVTVFGKISVAGSQQSVRGSIASMAENIRVELNKICAEARREMKLPIIIRLHGAKGDEEQPRSVVSKITRLDGQYQLLLHVHLAKGVDQSLLRYHLMELFLYERGLGEGQFLAEGERVIVKPWLVVGMLEAVDIKRGKVDKRIYQAGIDYFEILPLEEVFDASLRQWREMIGREPIAFRAISGALLNSLLRQQGGRQAMSAYLADFATFKGEPENLLRKHFPGMNKSTNSLQKWVSLELLELGTARVTQVHSILETESRLENILKLRYRDGEGAALSVAIDRYQEVINLEQAERVEAVASARAELERLSYRCFPSYRPLLNEYDAVLRNIIQGKDEGIDARLVRLADVRMKMQTSAKRVRDYLDWYYITRSHEVSGDFEKYRALAEALKKEKMRPPVGDSTEQYLDEVQRVFGSGSR